MEELEEAARLRLGARSPREPTMADRVQEQLFESILLRRGMILEASLTPCQLGCDLSFLGQDTFGFLGQVFLPERLDLLALVLLHLRRDLFAVGKMVRLRSLLPDDWTSLNNILG